MRLFKSIVAIALVLMAVCARAQENTAGEPDSGEINIVAEQPALEDFLWVARPVVIFADTPNDPRFQQQVAMLQERQDDLAARDVVILIDTDPSDKGPLRLKLRPRGFGLVLIDKDGSVAKRMPAPTSSRELINLIDRMPSRRQEIGSMRQ